MLYRIYKKITSYLPERDTTPLSVDQILDLNGANKNTFCIYSLMHLNSYPDDRLKPCCMADKYFEKASLKKQLATEIFNGEEFKKWRLDLFNGSKNELCSACWKNEDLGIQSHRMRMNKQYADKIDKYIRSLNEDGSIEPKFLFLDLRPSNICNLKCRTCSSEFSTKWIEEEDAFNKEFGYNIGAGTQRVTNLDFPINSLKKLERIYVAGGEPLYMQSMFDFLESIPKKKNVELIFQTNFMYTKYKDISVFDRFKEFGKVVYNISIDGVGEIGEYIRTGFSWERFVKNVNELIDHENSDPKKYSHNFQYTYSVFNCFHFYEFRKKMYELGFVRDDEDIIVYPVVHPVYQSVNRYNIKKEAQKYLLDGIGDLNSPFLKELVENLIKHVTSKPNPIDFSDRGELLKTIEFGNKFNKTKLPKSLVYISNLNIVRD